MLVFVLVIVIYDIYHLTSNKCIRRKHHIHLLENSTLLTMLARGRGNRFLLRSRTGRCDNTTGVYIYLHVMKNLKI